MWVCGVRFWVLVLKCSSLGLGSGVKGFGLAPRLEELTFTVVPGSGARVLEPGARTGMLW